jgi:uncharacterized membrane protein
MPSPCDKLSDNPYTPSSKDLKILGKTIRDNYLMLLLTLVFTVVAISVIVYIVYQIVEAVRIYYRYYVRSDRAVFKESDDETYEGGTEKDEISFNDEYEKIRSKIASIKDKHSSYNKEIGSYTRNILNREPDDLINENILSRENDDYDYTDN